MHFHKQRGKSSATARQRLGNGLVMALQRLFHGLGKKLMDFDSCKRRTLNSEIINKTKAKKAILLKEILLCKI
jgi:hypothetical protein